MFNITTWKQGAKRAPHKPLLLLYALGAWKRGVRKFPWPETKEAVNELIRQFGGSANANAQYPFVRLMREGIWVVEPLMLQPNGDARISDLERLGSTGRFVEEFETKLAQEGYLEELVQQLLDEHFSETMHEDLCVACGLNSSEKRTYTTSRRLARDPQFRGDVLDAYEHQCAICSYKVMFRGQLIGVEAAHIQWHNSAGPDHVTNGLALCAIHHKLLDYGAIGLSDEYTVLAAPGLHGNHLDQWIYQFENQPIRLPRTSVSEPSIDYVRWQRREVFKG